MRRSWLVGGGVGLGLGLVVAGLVASASLQAPLERVDPATGGDAGAGGGMAALDDAGERDEPPGPASGSAPVAEPPAPDEATGADRGSEGEVTGPDAAHAPDGVLRVRMPRGLDQALVDDIALLPDVLAVSVSPSGTVGLVGSRAADGTVRDRPPDGFRIPVAVNAIDPAATAATLVAEGADDALHATVAELEPGQALLTVSAARARGVGVGGQVDLDGLADLVVVGLVPDDDAGRTEVLVHRDDAESLALRPGRSLTIRHEAAPGEATDGLITAIEAFAPAEEDLDITDVAARARERAEAGAAATGRSPLVLGLPGLKATFGEFAYRPRSGVREIDLDPAFVTDNIVSDRVPLLGNVRCHRGIIDDLAAALGELEAVGLGSWVDPARYGGCFYARRIGTDRGRLSSHSWGVAVDINVDLSLPGGGPVPPEQMIEIFGRHGFRWGGDFTTPDNHHWEWVGDRAGERRDREPARRQPPGTP